VSFLTMGRIVILLGWILILLGFARVMGRRGE
jgi:hypothetical protein